MTNIELANEALKVYENKDSWTYCQGGLGEYSNSARIKNLYTYYREKGNSSTCDYDEWVAKYGINGNQFKQCTDCSNFIQYLVHSGKNASAWHYTMMQDAGDLYTAPVGSILLINSSHVGIVTQQGVKDKNGNFIILPEAIDFYAYNQTCRKACYIGALWTKAVFLDGIEYVKDNGPKITNQNGKYLIYFDTYEAAESFINAKL